MARDIRDINEDSPLAVSMRRSQAALAVTSVSLVANTPKDILAADAKTTGARILNWTASPVYIQYATGANPGADAPSDFVPAAVSGIPGQLECPFAPLNGISAKGASAGNLTVVKY